LIRSFHVLEFTGERVVPGQVEPDLWNEHLARYLFAARLAGRKRVLDIGCGTGYGAAELARVAASVAAFDLSPQAIAQARPAYPLPNLHFLTASAAAIPFPDATFGLITCFEVIEHVADWQTLLQEAQRLLARGGQFIVSTPNKLYYAESREQIGPNPFHVHEFEYGELREALSAVFPSVTLYLQNHVGGLSFQPVAAPTAQSPDLHLEPSPADARHAHFFVAVCAVARQTGAPAFLHIPSTSNVLREREGHVHKLQDEIRLKDTWLKQHQEDLSKLLAAHTAQGQELEQAQSWAQTEHEQFEAARCELLATAHAYEERLAAAEMKAKALLDEQTAELEKVQLWAQSEHEQFEALGKAYRVQTGELSDAQKWAQSEHEQFEAARRELLATSQAYEERLAANERAANEILDRRAEELESAQTWAQSEHEQFEAARRQLLATNQAYEDRLAASERAANDLLSQRDKELEKARRWAQSEHQQFQALSHELGATSERYEALLETKERHYEEVLNPLRLRLPEAEDQRRAALEEINRLRSILYAVQQSLWVKLGRSIKIGPDLSSF
jgi:SAM-dependent methyltransferase